MAHAGAQQLFHAALKGGQLLHRDKGLDGAGKAAAVDPDSASALQQLPADGQSHGDGLLLGVGDGPGVLQIQGGGDAGGIPILAAFAMDISFFGIMTRLIRTNMIQVLKQDYIRASRAKGLSSVNVILRHGLKNILIPVLTRLVSIVIGFFCGSAVIESIFSIQGIGNLALKSVISKDTPVLQCFIFILAVGIVVLNFLVDIAYSAIDRRIQLK